MTLSFTLLILRRASILHVWVFILFYDHILYFKYIYIFFLCVSIYIYIYIYIYFQSKVFGHQQNFLFLILKVLFLMKQVKHHYVFICHTKYKSFSVTLILV